MFWELKFTDLDDVCKVSAVDMIVGFDEDLP